MRTDAVDGIGPELASRLEAAGFRSTEDLCAATADELHAVVRSSASLDNVRRWKRIAAFLDVPGMTPPQAKALVEAGLRGVRDVAALATEEARRICVGDVDPPTAASERALGELLRAASVRSLTGVLAGVVVDGAGAPVAGATIRVGRTSVTSDDRGRFRVVGFPRSPTPRVYVLHPSFVPRIGRVHASFDPDATERVRIVLVGVPAGRAATPSRRLTDLDGDVVPRPRGEPVVTEEFRAEDLRRGDVLRVVSAYADGTTMKLVSTLRAYEGGRFIVRWARCARADLPDGTKVGAHVRATAAGLVRTGWGAGRARAYRRLLRSLRERTPPRRTAGDGRPDPADLETAVERIRRSLGATAGTAGAGGGRRPDDRQEGCGGCRGEGR